MNKSIHLSYLVKAINEVDRERTDLESKLHNELCYEERKIIEDRLYWLLIKRFDLIDYTIEMNRYL
jgi:hypothetical protein